MLARCGFVSALALAVLALSGTLAQEKAQPKPGALEQAARAFVEQLDKGEFAKATQRFNPAMLKGVPPDELKKTWEQIVAKAGVFQKQLDTRVETQDGYDIVIVACEFAKATYNVRLVFDLLRMTKNSCSQPARS